MARGIVLEAMGHDWGYSDWNGAVYEACEYILDRINELDEARMTEFVMYARGDSTVYHRRVPDSERRRDGAVLKGRVKCGRFMGLGTHRMQAIAQGMRACSFCYRPGE